MSHPEGGSIGRPRRWWVRGSAVFGFVLTIAVVFWPRHGVYASYSSGRMCATCHEVAQPYAEWHASTHRNIACGACHGSLFSADVNFHLHNLHRVITHARGGVPEQIALRANDVQKMTARCQTCHQQEYAKWAAGPHGATFKEFFLNEDHNRRMHLSDDCLRCHGMFFGGGIRDLVTPTDTKGPWHLRDTKIAAEPAIPCLTCHQVHRAGDVLSRSNRREDAKSIQQTTTPSLALFDRREFQFVAIAQLTLPAMLEQARPVRASPDPRQSLCYECHAPLVTKQIGSGDDHTPVGVHEGISCFSCHSGHSEQTRASCSTCHPQFSNCGLNVENMDTTFRDGTSRHNIHSVKCIDCHSGQVPQTKPRSPSRLQTTNRAMGGEALPHLPGS